ncbi:sigma factor-like helix-turn-helix DNA-binding protein [Streptomyces sp. NPDC054796]
MRALPVEYRQAFEETCFRGRTVQEAARALGLPAGTVKARLYHGMRALSRAMAEDGARSGAGARARAGAGTGADERSARTTGARGARFRPGRRRRDAGPPSSRAAPGNVARSAS